MKDFKYKGFIGSVEFDEETQTLYGQVRYIKGVIAYESADGTVPELKKAFEEAVDEYLEDCEEMGLKPFKSVSGIFQVRLTPELHYQSHAKANEEGITLNELVKNAVTNYINQDGIHHHHHQPATNYYLYENVIHGMETGLGLRETASRVVHKYSDSMQGVTSWTNH